MHKVLPPVPYISCFIECLQSYYIFHSLGDTRGNREKRNLQKERKFIFVTGKEEDCISEFHPVSIEALMYMERKRKKKKIMFPLAEKKDQLMHWSVHLIYIHLCPCRKGGLILDFDLCRKHQSFLRWHLTCPNKQLCHAELKITM